MGAYQLTTYLFVVLSSTWVSQVVSSPFNLTGLQNFIMLSATAPTYPCGHECHETIDCSVLHNEALFGCMSVSIFIIMPHHILQ